MIHPKHKDADALWRRLGGESLFITGGSGYFGRWFLEGLHDANRRLRVGIRATVLTRNPEGFRVDAPHLLGNGAIDLVRGDVVDFEFPLRPYDRIIHLATTSARETFSGEDQLAKFNMLVRGTERVLQFAGQSGAKKVLFTSSGVAYGALPEGMHQVPEDYPGAPDTTLSSSALGQGKRSAEFLCAYYAEKHGFEFTVARCFSFVGPRLPLDIHYAIGNFMRDALHADAITVKGDGSPMRSFMYMGDLVVWLLSLLVEGESARIYNVGSDQAISIRDLAQLVRDELSPGKPVEVLGDRSHSVGNFGRNWYVPSIERARRELGLDVWTPLQEAIRMTAQHAQRQSEEHA